MKMELNRFGALELRRRWEGRDDSFGGGDFREI
jgi:hypothetical protein